MFMLHLRAQLSSGNPETLPWMSMIPRGTISGGSGGCPTSDMFVAAYWCNSCYMGTEDPFKQTETWIMDLLPECPRGTTIPCAWRSTVPYFFIAQLRDTLAGKKDVLAPSCEDDLH